MNRTQQAWVWLRRAWHCRGFGIQSPTDYRFVRYVINEHWPYYAYQTMGTDDNWHKRKLGQLYFRLANFLQPSVIIDLVGAEQYLKTACPKAIIKSHQAKLDEKTEIDLALVPIQTEYQRLFQWCTDKSVVVFENIYQQPSLWHCIEYDPRVKVTFDLYYCGIVLFDSSRAPHNYIINF